ncbi:hypothetical protein ACFL1P_01065 [Patescibacteria group bacterium]
MKNNIILGLGTLALVGIFATSVNSVEAFGGYRGMKHMGNESYRLVPEEMREQFRVAHQNLTEEEHMQLREEHKAKKQEIRQEKRVAVEEFTGLSHDEIREAKQDGRLMGDILEGQGKTQEDAETFLTEQVGKKIDMIVDRHDLTNEQEETIQNRLSTFVQNVLNRWFGNN